MATRRSCSSTRSTAPTRSSRRTCSRSCPTSRSRCPRSARSAPSSPPRVILTSNRTREVHDALKRRCLYHWIDYPTRQKEYEIVSTRVPGRAAAARARGRRLRPSPADGRPDEGPRRRRDARLGGRADGARRRRARRRRRRRDARRRPQVRGGHPPCAARPRGSTSRRPAPPPARGSGPPGATPGPVVAQSPHVRARRVPVLVTDTGEAVDGRRLLAEAVGFGRALRAARPPGGPPGGDRLRPVDGPSWTWG